MKIKISEEQLINNLSKLSDTKYHLPQFLFQQLKKNKTSLGDNPAFPMEGEYPFDYKLIKDRFKEIVDEMEEYGFELNVEFAKNECSKLIQEAIELEKPLRDTLVKLCQSEVKHYLKVPEETVIYKCELVDEVHTDKAQRIMPEEDNGDSPSYEFEDVDDMIFADKEILKRRFCNALIQGGSYLIGNQILSTIEREIRGQFPQQVIELVPLYKKIDTLSNYILFSEEEKIDELNIEQGAYVEVILGNKNKKSIIKPQAIIYPYLVRESIRGFLELFMSHGLPEDNNRAMYLIRHADFMMAEAWDLRFGVSLWKSIIGEETDGSIIPYVTSEISTLETEDFFNIIKEILSGTKKGKAFKEDILAYGEECVKDNMSTPIDNTDDNGKTLISDNTEEMFTLDELKEMKF